MSHTPAEVALLNMIDSAEAVRLVSAWPVVGRAFAGGRCSARLLTQWADAARVSRPQAAAIMHSLIELGVCGANGFVHDVVQTAAGARGLASFSRAKRSESRREPPKSTQG